MTGFKRIAIVGLGLIGGSMALALKRACPESTIVGYSRRSETLQRARELGAIDQAGTDLESAVAGAELVYLAPPVLAIQDIMREVGPHLAPGCTVTDAGSTKILVMKWAREYLPASANFVGGHPMAGKELSGIDAADADLFKGCTYCLVPGANSTPQAVSDLTALVRLVGAQPVFIPAAEHDLFVAGISHLPFVIASALVNATSRHPSWKQMSELAASGYRDTTRLASQSVEMEQNICLSNSGPIVRWIDDFTDELGRLRRLIVAGDPQELEQALRQARDARERWLAEREHDRKN